MFAGLGTSSQSGYQTVCHMPHRTPFCVPVRGEVKPGKKAAKQSTALAICEMLHYYGELDHRLKVKKRTFVFDDEEEEEETVGHNPNNRKTGTKRMRRFYEKQQPKELTIEENPSFYYLNTIQFSLHKHNRNYKYRVPDCDSSSLAFLTSCHLPDIAPIPVHHPGGEYRAQIVTSKVARPPLDLIRNFHDYVFRSVLKVSGHMDTHSGDILVVPVKNGDIDLDLLREFSDETHVKIKRMSLTSTSKLLDAVVFPTYKENKENYFVEEIVPTSILNVDSKMPGEATTFREYYQTTYNLRVRGSGENLVRISSADKRSYMLAPGAEAKKSRKDVYNTTLFVQEFMKMEPISAGLWKQCQMLPFVLHRVSSLLFSRELLRSLGYNSSATLHLPSSLNTKPATFEDLLKIGAKSSDTPTPGHILQAVTLRAANDQFDMERLETLGDCFLKFYTGLFLYYKLLERDVITTEEGDLTSKRSRVVGNRNLCQVRILIFVCGADL